MNKTTNKINKHITMKNTIILILTLFFTLFLPQVIKAQTVTQIVVTAVIKLSNGQNFTNSVSSGNAAIFAAATNSMTEFNLTWASKDPPKPATTNLSQYITEFVKEEFNLAKNKYDYRMSQDLNIKLQSLSEARKQEIRDLINAP